ncbi:MAG: TlpA disulfide reductase family protein [Dehalococcoidales bacterium]|jgi:cytochrome c biogenesis protein CcmG/thiol:disulfide interchange protein DsbE|nr:TlpA disulfide reductase family protein [Dehalococcoidales bacterium]MDP6737885.1 TlpA disulfide reductase family protein [Dehalococcoidales bacterium]|tara:strand:- start:1371 stop:1907 length:537 start_codon:yes stop_codon:yes gene_type:complete
MSNRRILVLSLIILTVVGFVALLWGGLAEKEPLTGRSGAALLNNLAPDFTLPLFSEDNFTLSNLEGKPVVINFWASWCPPCRREAPALEKVWQLYKDKDVIFIGVNTQDSEADAQTFITEFSITYPNGPDVDGKITIDYGVSGLPVTFFTNREGRITNLWVGAISEGLLIAHIEEILQ